MGENNLINASDTGMRLAAQEQSNAQLRRLVRPETRAYLRRMGKMLKNDQSQHYAPSFAALAELKVFIATLGDQEQNALARAPFDTVDSHAHKTRRLTVMHELNRTASGGDCVHKFGDMLSQLPL